MFALTILVIYVFVAILVMHIIWILYNWFFKKRRILFNKGFIVAYIVLSVFYGYNWYSFLTTINLEGTERLFISSDGKKIVFDAYIGPKHNIFTMNINGSHVMRITTNKWDSNPAFSRDGSKIVFTSSSGGAGTDIYVINADGSNKKRLTHTDGYWEHSPSFSPDGTKIAYSRNNDWRPEGVFLMNSDGSGEYNIYKPKETSYSVIGSPYFSPNGKSVIFSSDYADKIDQICIVDISTPNPTLNIIQKIEGRDPVFSPDGESIVFAQFRGEIFIYNLKTQKLTQVTRNSYQNFYPFFSSDGKKIFFKSLSKDGDYSICQININGSNLECINIKK